MVTSSRQLVSWARAGGGPRSRSQVLAACRSSHECQSSIFWNSAASSPTTFFMFNAEEARALLEKLSASERESEEHGLKENSCTVKIDPLTRKFHGMALTQPAASETHQAEQEILAQPSDEKKMPMSRISSNTILDKLWNRVSGPTLPIVPCILGTFKVHHAPCDWRASMNILPKMVYDCLDEDPLVPTPHELRLADPAIQCNPMR
jgi:hypothetical protein